MCFVLHELLPVTVDFLSSPEVKNLTAWSREMAKCPSTLTQKIPWTKDSGGLQTIESQRVLPLSTAHTAPAVSSNKGYYSPAVCA